LIALFLPLAALMGVLSEPVCHALADATIARANDDSDLRTALEGSPAQHERLVGVALAVRSFSLGNDDAALPPGTDYHDAITPDAVSHLRDVRTVFIACELGFALVFAALLVLIIIAVRRSGATCLSRPLIIGGAVPLAAALILGLAITLDFSAFFTWMHSLFFASGTWTFPADSLLIRALPFEFWVGCAAVWAGSMAGLCIVAILAGLLLKRRTKSAPH
jgi:integral membrane protein (TIGR01906 family)